MPKDRASLRVSHGAISLLKRLIGANLRVSGQEHIPSGSVLFVANHFTRAETLLLPYALYETIGTPGHSLAHHSLFHGLQGQILEGLGVVSVRQAGRDHSILHDLILAKEPWVIYPEGSMIKSRDVMHNGKLTLSVPGYTGPPRSGAAMLALKAELLRQKYCQAQDKGDYQTLKQLRKQFKLTGPASRSPVSIVPVSITYYPLRPQPNALQRLARRLIPDLPDRIDEELEIEGSLLRHGDISIHFGRPLLAADQLGAGFKFLRAVVPQFRPLFQDNALLRERATKLTRVAMERVYQNLEINLDHLVCGALREARTNTLSLQTLTSAVCTVACELRNRGYRLHASLDAPDQLTPHNPAFESILQLLRRTQVITQSPSGHLSIDQNRLVKPDHFHEIRRTCPAQVLANEIEPIRDAVVLLRLHLHESPSRRSERLLRCLLDEDLRCYEQEFAKTAPVHCMPPNRGAPRFLRARGSRRGIVLCHGYLSSPGEMGELAQFLCDQGWNVYCVRLAGHGTSPHLLPHIGWRQWITSFQRGVSILRTICDQVLFGGFSTGGVIALHVAAETAAADGVFAINPPYAMHHIKAGLVPIVNLLTHISGHDHKILSSPEFPDTNYSLVSLRSLMQVRELLRATRRSLPQIQIPTLIIRGDHDPTVDPAGSKRLFKRLGTCEKELITVHSDRHVIVRGGPEQTTLRPALRSFLDLHACPAVQKGN